MGLLESTPNSRPRWCGNPTGPTRVRMTLNRPWEVGCESEKKNFGKGGGNRLEQLVSQLYLNALEILKLIGFGIAFQNMGGLPEMVIKCSLVLRRQWLHNEKSLVTTLLFSHPPQSVLIPVAMWNAPKFFVLLLEFPLKYCVGSMKL